MPETPPQEVVAQDFMARKGYPDIRPDAIETRGRFRWLFTYELAEGDLELRVEWLEAQRRWRASVEDFALVE